MKRYFVTLTGETPLLMHNDNLEWSDAMDKWRLDPGNKKNGKAGDDRTPAWRWIGSLYVNGNKIVIPSDNLMTTLREGGAKCLTGNGKQSFKSMTQSGIIVDDIAWPVLIDGKEVPYEKIKAAIENPDFEEHQALAKSLGFELFVKRAAIGNNKHVRVRPRFDTWACGGTVTVLESKITDDVLKNILTFAGAYSGIGDWRPSSPKSPGRFGKFSAVVKAV